MDPFTPPETPENSQSLDVTLHPIRSVVVATIFGSFVAAGIVMAINFVRLGKSRSAVKTMIWSVVATLGLIALVFTIPEDVNLPNSVYYVPQLFAVYNIAKALQGPDIEKHEKRGGKIASAWWSAGIGILCLPAMAVPVFGIAYLLEPDTGTLLTIGNDEVYYAGDATETEARKVADLLNEVGYFGNSETSVQISADSGRYKISFVLAEGAWNEPETVDAYRSICEYLATAGFETPLTVNLCDEYFEVQTTFVID